MQDRVKVNGRTNNLKEGGITISRSAKKLEFSASSIAVSKRYLKYLTKKYLKKNQLRDWLRVIATDKNTYVIKYYNVEADDAEE